MSFCFCGKYAPYAFKKQTGDLIWFCFDHAPKTKKLQKEKKEVVERIAETPIKLTEEKTGALYYDN